MRDEVRWGLGLIFIAILMALLLTSCSSSNTGESHIEKYSLTTFDYYVTVSERFTNGQCIQRIITLKAINKLHLGNFVEYVKAYDTGCNERFDQFQYRRTEDRLSYGRWLDDILLDALYQAKYGGGQT